MKHRCELEKGDVYITAAGYECEEFMLEIAIFENGHYKDGSMFYFDHCPLCGYGKDKEDPESG